MGEGEDRASDEERGTTSKGDKEAPDCRGEAPSGYGEVQPTSDPESHRGTAERLEGQNRQAGDTKGQRADDPGR